MALSRRAFKDSLVVVVIVEEGVGREQGAVMSVGEEGALSWSESDSFSTSELEEEEGVEVNSMRLLRLLSIS